MKCIVCGKKVCTDEEVCKECDQLLDMIHRKNRPRKERVLNSFREVQKSRENEEN